MMETSCYRQKVFSFICDQYDVLYNINKLDSKVLINQNTAEVTRGKNGEIQVARRGEKEKELVIG